MVMYVSTKEGKWITLEEYAKKIKKKTNFTGINVEELGKKVYG